MFYWVRNKVVSYEFGKRNKVYSMQGQILCYRVLVLCKIEVELMKDFKQGK